MYQFLSGAIMAFCFMAALFFYRFWGETRDRLFAIFASAFVLMGVERIALGVTSEHYEGQPYVYFFRLSAFILILYGIVDKNRKSA